MLLLFLAIAKCYTFASRSHLDNLNLLLFFFSVSQLKQFTLFILQFPNYLKGTKIKIHLDRIAVESYPVLEALTHLSEPYL